MRDHVGVLQEIKNSKKEPTLISEISKVQFQADTKLPKIYFITSDLII